VKFSSCGALLLPQTPEHESCASQHFGMPGGSAPADSLRATVAAAVDAWARLQHHGSWSAVAASADCSRHACWAVS